MDTAPSLSATHSAFTDAMSASFLVGAAGVVGAAVLAAFLMKGKGAPAADSEADAGLPETEAPLAVH
ncbi:hypothetical protein [Streptomyces sp. NPDC050485]|uniref:hypothetical protein n=1 Tax=Streptomyces sp. NPDC050485 TaxID=3365617 RepID=UPI0037B1F930